MKIFKNLSLKNKSVDDNQNSFNQLVNQYDEIGKLIKEARIKKNISIKELSQLSKIPESTINSIENNIENIRPEYPFIRSILFKLEECLSLRKNTLVGLLIKDTKDSKKVKRKFIVSKFDFLNTWQGTLLYFLILILTIFILKRYFLFNEIIIDLQGVEQKINQK